MKSPVPKQFLNLHGVPVLMHAMKVFFDYNPSISIVLVLPESHHKTWNQLVEKHQLTIPHKVVSGGKERFHSVKAGLNQVNEGLVAIHDGVRPLVSKNTIARCFQSAELKGSGIPVIPLVNSIRKTSENGSVAVNRSQYVSVQTPQCFEVKKLKNCFEKNYHPSFTDDAAVWEAGGYEISLVDGNPENIKITNPFDLTLGEALLKK